MADHPGISFHDSPTHGRVAALAAGPDVAEVIDVLTGLEAVGDQRIDEMISATVADQLRARGHDVVAVQDDHLAHLRGIADCLLLSRAADERRAVVTDDVPDLLRCHDSAWIRWLSRSN